MPPKSMRLLVAMIAFVFVLVPAAWAQDPPTAKQTITSADFNSSNGGFVLSPLDVDYPALAYWGRISSTYHSSGYSLWCAGTKRFPAVVSSTYFNAYPYYGSTSTPAQQTREPVLLTSTTPKALTYLGAYSIEVWSASSGGSKYADDDDYVIDENTQGYKTIARVSGTSIPNGATVYVTYKFKHAGTRGNAKLSVPQLANYYRSWVSFYYLMPSLGTNDNFGFYWNTDDAPGTVESHYGTATFPVNSSWVQKTWELSAGDSVSMAREAGAIWFQFYDHTPGAGGVANGQGPAVDDVVISGYKYGPVSTSSMKLVAGASSDPVAVATYQSSYVDSGKVTLSGTDTGQMDLTWDAPPTTPTDSSADTRDMSYRVWRKTGSGSWEELTSSTNRVSERKVTDALAPGSYTYGIQAWDVGSGSSYGQLATKSFVVSAAASDSGIAGIEYRVSGESTQTVAAASKALTFGPRSTPYTIDFRVKDGDGNWSAVKTITFSVKASTYLSISGNQTLSYGKSGTISGYLKHGSSAATGQRVYLQRLSGRTSGSWVDVGSKWTDSSGKVSFYISAGSSGYNYTKTYYRLRYAGSSLYVSASPSSSRYMDPKAYLGKPWSSKKTVKAKKTYTWYSYIKPRHSSGSKPVKLQFQYKKNGKWRTYKTVSAKAYNYSSYSRVKVKVKLYRKASWRVRAYHDDAGHAKSYSSWRYFKVK